MALGKKLLNGLMEARVMHARTDPKRHAFRYDVYYLCFDLAETSTIQSSLLSLNRWNLFSFYDCDHGARDGTSLLFWIQNILREWNIPEADGAVILLTFPRVLGYAFNPVSFWFCLDKQGNLRAVLSEVCNTFGESHCYLSFHDDHGPITNKDWLRAEKLLHVSPFMDVTGYYLFRFSYSATRIDVAINHHTEKGLMLTTSVSGNRTPLSSAQLLKCFVKYPLMTLKVIMAIHFEAARLFFKGAHFRSKPVPPSTRISR